MPIYEYRCQACQHELEKLQKLSDPVLVDCPQCGKPALTKLISAAGFRLKGSGWYETDFKKDRRRNLAGENSSSAGTDAAAKSADSAPASKPDQAAGSAATGPAA